MGIPGLSNFLKKRTSNGIREISLSKYKNKKIAIDVSIFLYKYVYLGNYIHSFIKQIIKLLEHRITPIYIFDGKPTKDKDETIKKRVKEREKNKKKVNDLNEEIDNLEIEKDTLMLQEELTEKDKYEIMDKIKIIQEKKEKVKKLDKNMVCITSIHIKKIKELLEIIDIPYTTSSGESDILCKSLAQLGYVDACITEDMDFLTHGCNKILRKFDYNSNKLIEYSLPEILSDLDIIYSEFVDLCILMGCDYSKKLFGIGPVTAYKYITKYRTIENILSNIDCNSTEFNYEVCRKIFSTTFKINNINLEIGKLDYKSLMNFLEENDIDNNNGKIIKKLINRMKIKSITHFFKKKL